MMKYLIFNDAEFQNIRADNQDVLIEAFPVYFSFGFVQNERTEIIKISQAIQGFHVSKKESILVLFLGVVNHWTVLVAHKKSLDDKPKLIYLDSQSNDILNLDDITLGQYLDEKDLEYRELVGKQSSLPFYRKYFKHCVYDTRMLLRNLENIIVHNKEQFHTFCCRRSMHNVFKSFEGNMSFIVDSETKAMIKYENLIKKSSNSSEPKDYPISEEFRMRLYSLDPGDDKEQLKEFFFPVSDAVLDYSNIMKITRDDIKVVSLVENLHFWMFEYHPTHIYSAIYLQMVHYGSSCLDDQDMENLKNWVDAIQHILDLTGLNSTQIPEYNRYKTKQFDEMSKLTCINI